MKKKVEVITIDKMIFPNESMNNTAFDKKVIMKGGIFGQKVEVLIQKNRKDKIQAKILNVVEKSHLETQDVCKNYGKCGGCSMLSVPYETQLELKKNQILDLFHKNNHTEINDIEIVGSSESYEYKNKMEFTFGNEVKDGELVIGLHKKNSAMSIVDVSDCMLVDSDYRSILVYTRDYFRSQNISHYHIMSHKGYLRHLVIRKGKNTGDILINIVTTSQINFDFSDYVREILDLSLCGKITGILHTINDSLSDTVLADKLNVLYGNKFFYDRLFNNNFKISPFSFFQTNTNGSEILYKTAIDMIDGQKDIICDLYSGTGTIGINLSKRAKKVIGIEIIEEAVEMARENAINNNIENIEFIAGDVKEEVIKLMYKNVDKSKYDNEHIKDSKIQNEEDFCEDIYCRENTSISKKIRIDNVNEDIVENYCRQKLIPDLIVLDPPRAGMSKKALDDVISFCADEILYISCNPKMLMNDLNVLKDSGYVIKYVKCVDMFPNTYHVECIALIQRVKL